ncbi:zeta toxin family protein [Streptomyces sp. SYSU K217416]
MAEASDYFLTEEQLRDRFEERVRDFVFSGYSPQEQPVLVLLGGQPAAGKSQAMAAAEQRHAGRQLVPLTGDELRAFHPQYQELLDEQPLLFPNATAQASGAWVRMSIEHARTHGYSLILEGVFRNPEMTVTTAEEFAAISHRVELVGLGVRVERSRLDSLHRYLEAGRWTPPTAHDSSYRMMPETIAAAEASPAVQRITLTDRTGADLYVNERLADGRWSLGPTGAEALHAIRARPFPTEEVAGWLARHQDIVVEFAVRGEINATTVPVLNEVASNADTVAAMDPDPHSPARREHAAVRRLLHVLASEPITSANALPLLLVPDDSLTASRVSSSSTAAAYVGAEMERRRTLPPAARQAEDALRRNLNERLRAVDRTSPPEPPARIRPPANRPSSDAARSRSTTVRKPPGADRPAAPGAAEQPSHLRRPGPDHSHRRGPTI